MSSNRLVRLAFLEKREGSEGDWSPSELLYLAKAAELLGVDVRRFPIYPVLADEEDPVIARAPVYELLRALELIGDHYGDFLACLHRPVKQGRFPAEGLPLLAEAAHKERLYAQFDATARSKQRLQAIGTPWERGGTVVTKRGTIPWHQIPALILGAPCGRARKWFANGLLARLYHPWRLSPSDLGPLLDIPQRWKPYYELDI